MKINNITYTGNVNWVGENLKYFKDFVINNEKLGKVKITIGNAFQNYDRIDIVSPSNEAVGQETIKMEPDKKLMTGFYIVVDPILQRSKAKVGEILRLSSIMEMLSNGIDKIKIYSRDSSVLFHGKYGFEPHITKFRERDVLLKQMAQLKEPQYSDIKKRAEFIQEQIQIYKDNDEKQRLFCNVTSLICNDYINRILKTPQIAKETKFDVGMEMILGKDKILKNKNFYNALYQKHNIDFQI